MAPQGTGVLILEGCVDDYGNRILAVEMEYNTYINRYLFYRDVSTH